MRSIRMCIQVYTVSGQAVDRSLGKWSRFLLGRRFSPPLTLGPLPFTLCPWLSRPDLRRANYLAKSQLGKPCALSGFARIGTGDQNAPSPRRMDASLTSRGAQVGTAGTKNTMGKKSDHCTPTGSCRNTHGRNTWLVAISALKPV